MSTEIATGTAAVQGDLWSELADDWTELMEPVEAPFHRAGLDAVGVGPGTALLDVGCGAGAVLRMAADRGADVTGIDASPALVAHAQRRVPGARIEVGDLQFLPFDDESFDVVTGFNAFQYAADPKAALLEARRVLRPEGRVLLLTWGPLELCEAGVVLGQVSALMPPPPPGTPGPFALADEGALEALLDSAGLETVKVADVDTPYAWPAEEIAVRAFVAPGPVVKAARHAGAEALDRTVRGALAAYRQPDGSYRLDNVFRYAVARLR